MSVLLSDDGTGEATTCPFCGEEGHMQRSNVPPGGWYLLSVNTSDEGGRKQASTQQTFCSWRHLVAWIALPTARPGAEA